MTNVLFGGSHLASLDTPAASFFSHKYLYFHYYNYYYHWYFIIVITNTFQPKEQSLYVNLFPACLSLLVILPPSDLVVGSCFFSVLSLYPAPCLAYICRLTVSVA